MAMAMVKSAQEPLSRRIQDVDRHVGARVRERRIMLGFTQQQLAELIGVTYRERQASAETEVAHSSCPDSVGVPGEEVEVTEAMIRAGLVELFSFDCERDPADEIVTGVYRVMEEARREELRKMPECL